MTGTLAATQDAPRPRGRHVRPVVWLVLAVVVALVVAVIGLPPVLSRVENARYQSLVDRVQRVGLPGGLSADPTLTQCRGIGVLCGTTSLTAEEAARAVADRLVAQGVSVGEVQCGDAVDESARWIAPEPLDCVSVGRSFGRAVLVEVRNTSTADDAAATAPGQTWVRVKVMRSPLLPGGSAPDVTWSEPSAAPSGVSDLSMLPDWLARAATCERTADVCLKQKFTTPLPAGMTPEEGRDQLVASLTRSGFAVTKRGCEDVVTDAGVVHHKCVVIAERYVLTGGQGLITVMVFLNGGSGLATGLVWTP